MGVRENKYDASSIRPGTVVGQKSLWVLVEPFRPLQVGEGEDQAHWTFEWQLEDRLSRWIVRLSSIVGPVGAARGSYKDGVG